HGATSTRFSMRVRPVGLGFPRSPQRKLLRAANVGGWPPAQSPVQSRVKRTGAIPARRQSERYGAYLSRRSLSLCWPLNQQPSLNVKTARSWRGIVPFTHLAREGRMTVTIGRRELLAALGGSAATWPLAARAQAYPSRPVTIVVPYPAGGPTDTLARILAERMRAPLGQPVIIENPTGAGGAIGTGRVA